MQLRVRAVKIDPADKDRTGLGLSLSQKTIPEVDISDFLTRNKKHRVGLAAQAGFDYMLDKRWSINVDVKKIQMSTDGRSAGASVGKFKIDPLLVGVGAGYRF